MTFSAIVVEHPERGGRILHLFWRGTGGQYFEIFYGNSSRVLALGNVGVTK